MKISKSILVFMLAGILAACAGRAPQPVAIVTPNDRFMNCDAIMIEVEANNKKIAALGAEEGGKMAQNVVAGVVGVFFLPAFLAMDFQGTASKETAALQSRQQYLATLVESKKCNEQQAAMPASSR